MFPNTKACAETIRWIIPYACQFSCHLHWEHLGSCQQLCPKRLSCPNISWEQKLTNINMTSDCYTNSFTLTYTQQTPYRGPLHTAALNSPNPQPAISAKATFFPLAGGSQPVKPCRARPQRQHTSTAATISIHC